MKNYNFKTSNGDMVELTEDDMRALHQYYEEQLTADYFRDNFPDWTEEKIQKVASDTRFRMYKYGDSEADAMEIEAARYDEGESK